MAKHQRIICSVCGDLENWVPQTGTGGRVRLTHLNCAPSRNRMRDLDRLAKHTKPDGENRDELQEMIHVAAGRGPASRPQPQPETEVEIMAIGLSMSSSPETAARLVGLEVSRKKATQLATEAKELHADLISLKPSAVARVYLQTQALLGLHMRANFRRVPPGQGGSQIKSLAQGTEMLQGTAKHVYSTVTVTMPGD